MLQAVSSYLGGAIIDSSECDYETSRDFGLKCPFCQEAVFWAKDADRVVNGKKQHIRAHFKHYRNSNSIICENRALTTEGKKIIENLAIESKNQRLKLYNDRLRDIFLKVSGLSQIYLNAKKKYGKNKVMQVVINLAHKFLKYQLYFLKNYDIYVSEVKNRTLSQYKQHLLNGGEKLNCFDIAFSLHNLKIAKEIFVYLTTSKQDLSIFIFGLIGLLLISNNEKYQTDECLAREIFDFFVSLQWSEIISKELANPNRYKGVGFA